MFGFDMVRREFKKIKVFHGMYTKKKGLLIRRRIIMRMRQMKRMSMRI